MILVFYLFFHLRGISHKRCLFFFFFLVNSVIHWNEKALGSHVFPIPIPPPTSLPTRSLFTIHCIYFLLCTSFGHLMQRADSFEKTLILGKIEGRSKRGWQKMRWLDGITDTVHMSLSKLGNIVKGSKAWHAAVHGVANSETWWWLNNNNTASTQVNFHLVYKLRDKSSCSRSLKLSQWVFMENDSLTAE